MHLSLQHLVTPPPGSPAGIADAHQPAKPDAEPGGACQSSANKLAYGTPSPKRAL